MCASKYLYPLYFIPLKCFGDLSLVRLDNWMKYGAADTIGNIIQTGFFLPQCKK